ncbi:MAG: sigma-54 dependent transcriptional regulator [Gammaproteobacteria bacterium]|nr:sigma-54 dependent transcriptional regulator [Gammaproteobacteria bacterium]
MPESARILFVDDDPKAGELLMRFSEGAAYHVEIFQAPEKALAAFKENGADLIISDLRMPGMTGMELLEQVRQTDNEVPFIIITGYAEIDNAIEALRLGASDFIKKPFDMDELRVQIERTLERGELLRENRLLRRQLTDEQQRYGMVGHSEAMHKIYAIIDKVADIRCNVIIEGESGTGKELAARAIHYQGQYADKPFIVIDCGALTDTLLESELFGHEKGAFTGAVKAKPGLLEEASGGTVFLDEIGNISDAMQMKLLRVIQGQQVTRVGGLKPVDIDVRFIVATNQNLPEAVAAGRFRHDLYHRLNVVSLTMPSLRDRRDDIPLLLQFFIEKFAQQYHREVQGFEPRSIQRLIDYDWPGNVRELQNLVERHVVLADRSVMQLEHPAGDRVADEQGIDAGLPSLQELERRYIEKVLQHFNNNREQTASTLGINKSTLWRKLNADSKTEADPETSASEQN